MTNTSTVAGDVAGLFACRPDIIADRYPLYRRLREEAPVYFHGATVLLSRFDDVRSVHLMDDEFIKGIADLNSSELRAQYADLTPEQQRKLVTFLDFRGKWITAVNGADHLRLRTLANKSFTPRVLERVRGRVREVADELLDTHDGDVLDVIGDFAWQLPLIIISEMLDVPTDDREQIRRWSMDVSSFAGGGAGDYGGGLEAAYPSMFALKEHLQGIFHRRRGADTTDLMGALLAAQTDEGDRFTEDELVGMIAQLVWAGHETTTNLIGNGVYALLSHPDQWALLRDDPDRAPDAIQEVLRYLSPTHITRRMAVRDTEIRGVTIPPLQTVLFLLGSANRDPDQFTDPDRFDITRTDNKHLAFGIGTHFCLGAALARMEGTVALQTLARRYPRMTLVRPEVTWQPNTTFLSLKALPVNLNTAA